MGTDLQQNGPQDPPSSVEIEFALVLSRMIDAVKSDPLQLRDAVYELARRKLREQFTHQDAKDIRPLVDALEVAIVGVEAFSRRNDDGEKIMPVAAGEGASVPVALPAPISEARPPRAVVLEMAREKSNPFKAAMHGAAWRYVSAVIVILVIGIVLKNSQKLLDFGRSNAASTVSSPTSAIADSKKDVAAPPPEKAPSNLSPLLPTSYGVYAISDDKLYELELLPGRAPDIRIAISPIITTASRTILPDGHLKFIVFRRDEGTNTLQRAEVRVIAKIARATSFDAAGKPVSAKTSDSWVMRNISQPYRVAPIKDQPDMDEIHAENTDGVGPGRYALILKGQAYDFSVAGDVTDTRQCLERLAASNGEFYSECQKPSR